MNLPPTFQPTAVNWVPRGPVTDILAGYLSPEESADAGGQLGSSLVQPAVSYGQSASQVRRASSQIIGTAAASAELVWPEAQPVIPGLQAPPDAAGFDASPSSPIDLVSIPLHPNNEILQAPDEHTRQNGHEAGEHTRQNGHEAGGEYHPVEGILQVAGERRPSLTLVDESGALKISSPAPLTSVSFDKPPVMKATANLTDDIVEEAHDVGGVVRTRRSLDLSQVEGNGNGHGMEGQNRSRAEDPENEIQEEVNEEEDEAARLEAAEIELQNFLEEQYALLTRKGKDATLDGSAPKVHDLMAIESFSAVLQLSTPFTGAVCNKYFRAILLVLCIIFAFWFGVSLYHRFSTNYAEVTELRLTPIQLKGGGSPETGGRVAELGGLFDECRVKGANMTRDAATGATTVAFRERESFNGWYLKTAEQDPELQVVRWKIEGRLPEEVFEDIGSDAWRLEITGGMKKVHRFHSLPDEPLEQYNVFIYPSWPWFLRIFGVFLAPALGLVACMLLGSMKREKQAKNMLFVSLMISAVMVLIAGAAFTYMGEFHNSYQDWVFSVLTATVAYLLYYHEMIFIQAFALVCALYPFFTLLDEAILTRFRTSVDTLHYTILVGCLAVAFLVAHAAVRHRWNWTKERLLQATRVVLDERWRDLTSNDDFEVAAAIQVITRLCRSKGKKKSLAQRCRPEKSSALPFHSFTWLRHPDGTLPVNSLDQLYTQASGAKFLLENVVRRWAIEHDGMCRIEYESPESRAMRTRRPSLSNTEVVVNLEEAHNYKAASDEGVRFVKLKPPKRAVEKGLKLYQGDLSQLLDLCRGRIVFERLYDLGCCLETILRDPDVHVVFIRNYFHPHADARYNGGIRDVRIQLRVITAEAMLLGVSSHICEILLSLRILDELESAQFHRRLQAFRDAAWWSFEVSPRKHIHDWCLRLCHFHIFQGTDDEFKRAASGAAGTNVSGGTNLVRRLSSSRIVKPSNGLGRSLSITPSALEADSHHVSRSTSRESGTDGAGTGAATATTGSEMVSSGQATGSPAPGTPGLRRTLAQMQGSSRMVNMRGLSPIPGGEASGSATPEQSPMARGNWMTLEDLVAREKQAQARGAARGGVARSNTKRMTLAPVLRKNSIQQAPSERSRLESFSVDERARELEDMTPHDWTQMLFFGMSVKGGMLQAVRSSSSGAWALSQPDANLEAWRREDGKEGAPEIVDLDVNSISVSPERRLRAMRLAMLIQQFRHASRTPAKLLDMKTKDVNEAMAETSSASVFHTSLPVAAALSKPWFQLFLGFMSMLFFYLFMRSALYAVRGLTSTHKFLRFEATALRGGGDAATMEVVEFGALFNGCPVEGVAETLRSGNQFTTTFTDEVTINGWYLRIADGAAEEADPVEFKVEGSEDKEHWDMVGASSLFISDNGEFRFDEKGEFEGEMPHGEPVLFNYVLPWQYLFRMTTVNLDGCITMAAAAVAGIWRRHHLGKGFIVLGTTVASVLFAATAIGYDVESKYAESFAPWMFAGGNLLLSWFLAFRETFVMQQTMLVGCCFTLTAILENTVIDWDPLAVVHPLRSFPFTGVILIGLGVTLGMYRHHILQSSAKAIQNDKRQYEEAWDQLLLRGDDNLHVHALKLLLAGLPSEIRDKNQKQPLKQSINPAMYGMNRRENSRDLTPWDLLSFLRFPSAQRNSGQDPPPSRSTTLADAASVTSSHHHHPASRSSPLAGSPLAIASVGQTASSSTGGADGGGGPASPLLAASSRARSELHPTALSDPSSSTQHSASAPERRQGTKSTDLSSMGKRVATEVGSLGKKLGSAANLMISKKEAALSLDTLFAQAAGAQVELDAKAREWSLACGGLVELLPGGDHLAPSGSAGRRLSRHEGAHGHRRIEFRKLEEALESPALVARMKQGKLKGWKRAIEKLLRCYQGDVGRLLDVSRSALVLESAADIMCCLEIIMRDPEIVLCRIQNRLDPKYDSAISAGYRDVGLNLQIQSDWTRRLGIDGHVCELQLLLREFAELKHDEGHKHYVEFRNLRGC